MPRRKVVLSGLLAFGAGVAVGANWPRAGNIVGYLLQRLGFELTDLTLWMWDPEKSIVRSAKPLPGGLPKAKKRTPARLIQGDDPNQHKARAKANKTAHAPRIQSGAAITRATRTKATTGPDSWIRPDGLDGPSVRTNGRYVDSPLIRSVKTGGRARRTRPMSANASLTQPANAAIRTLDRKSKSAAVKGKRSNPAARHGGKLSAFPPSGLPADAALN